MLRYYTKTLNRTINYTVLRHFSKLYTKDHEWIELNGDIATIGITDHAQNELGEIVHVDLPKVGDQFSQHDSLVIYEFNA
jgi:glycine cleavage system H lipoate-binding protein